MVRVLSSDIPKYEDRIKQALLEVLDTEESQIDRVIQLLKEDSMQCWLLLRDAICIGYCITYVIKDLPTDKSLLLIYLLKTIETATNTELNRLYVNLCSEAKRMNCHALSFYSSFQNESKYQSLVRMGAVSKTYFYMEV